MEAKAMTSQVKIEEQGEKTRTTGDHNVKTKRQRLTAPTSGSSQ